MTLWGELGAAARDLVLPEDCAGCGRPSGVGVLCSGCAESLRASRARPAVRVCPSLPAPGFPATYAGAWYTAPVRRVVVAYKEHGRLDAARPLGRLLAAATTRAAQAADTGAQGLVLVPVPSRRGATRARGHHPVRRLAAVVRRTLAADRPVRVADVLVMHRRVVDQTALTRDQRGSNLAHGIRARRPIERDGGSVVVVVDDVCASGATLAAAATALRRAGVPEHRVVAAVVAAPAPHVRQPGEPRE